MKIKTSVAPNKSRKTETKYNKKANRNLNSFDALNTH